MRFGHVVEAGDGRNVPDVAGLETGLAQRRRGPPPRRPRVRPSASPRNPAWRDDASTAARRGNSSPSIRPEPDRLTAHAPPRHGPRGNNSSGSPTDTATAIISRSSLERPGGGQHQVVVHRDEGFELGIVEGIGLTAHWARSRACRGICRNRRPWPATACRGGSASAVTSLSSPGRPAADRPALAARLWSWPGVVLSCSAIFCVVLLLRAIVTYLLSKFGSRYIPDGRGRNI